MAAPKKTVAAKNVKPAARSTSPVRNSAIPPKAASAPAPAKKVITHDQIAARAYTIWQSGTGGSEADNWSRAERELRTI